jgi:hypothetical protein
MIGEMTFVGVQNVSGKLYKASFGGSVVVFEKDEIKVVPAPLGQHLLSRAIYISEDKDGNRILGRKLPFKSVPLTEALKSVKEPENKSIAAAKKEAIRQEKLEQDLTDRIISRMKKDGWKPPVDGTPNPSVKSLKL